MIQAAGAPERVGIKVNPGMQFNDIQDQDPIATHLALVNAINRMNLAYLHVMRAGIGAEDALRKSYPGTFLLGGGFQKAEASEGLEIGRADAIVFGASYLANPDLVERFRQDASLNTPDQATFYTRGPSARGEGIGRALADARGFNRMIGVGIQN